MNGGGRIGGETRRGNPFGAVRVVSGICLLPNVRVVEAREPSTLDVLGRNCYSDCLQQIVVWVALQIKDSIPIFSLLQQQDLKDNTLCKWSRRENTQIWVMPLLILKIGLLYGYSVGGYRYCVGNLFWI